MKMGTAEQDRCIETRTVYGTDDDVFVVPSLWTAGELNCKNMEAADTTHKMSDETFPKT